jgi:ABC transporter substrate binding protein
MDLVASRPDLILASATEGLAAFSDATKTIPIVFVSVSDPVGQGFVSNLARPGGNITGFTAFEFSMGGKWIEILKEIAPKLARVAVLFNPKTAPYFASFLQSIETGAVSVALPWTAAPVNDLAEIEPKITAFAREPNGGLICPSDSFTSVHRKTIISLAASHRLPTIYAWREFAPDGGLVTYIESTCIGAQRHMSIASYGGPIRANCQSSSRPSSFLSLISKPPRHSASTFHRRCSPAPTRSLNNAAECCDAGVRLWHSGPYATSLTCPLSGRMCCKTILTTEMSNIDSRMDTSAQYRSKTLLNQIRILPARHSASSFATHSGLKLTSQFDGAMSANDPKRKSRESGFAEQIAKFRASGSGLLRLDVGRPNHLAPLLGFLGDKLSEVRRRAR